MNEVISIELDDGQTLPVEPEDQRRLRSLLEEETEGHGFRISMRLDPGEVDTEGHGRAAPMVRVLVDAVDLDTEGHALTIRFPTAEAAEAFKKRLAMGMLAATLVAGGAAAGIAIAPSLSSTSEAAVTSNPPVVRDTDRYAGDWTPGTGAPARDTDRYDGSWTPGTDAPARDTDRYDGNWTPGAGGSDPAEPDRPMPRGAPRVE